MSNDIIVKASLRAGSGTSASRRARHAGQVPCVVYGGGEDDQYLLLDHNKMLHQIEVEAFYSALVKIEVDGDMQRAVVRDVQMHPYKAQILHIDFQRVSRKDTITMTVPLHFIGEDIAPGVKIDAGIMTHSMTSVDISCLGSDLPEYIEVDVSALELGGAVHLNEVTLPKGVKFSSSLQEADLTQTIASVLAPKQATVEEDEAVEGAAEGAAEGDAAE